MKQFFQADLSTSKQMKQLIPFSDLYGSLDVEPKPMKETKVRQSRRATGVDLSQLATQTAKTPQNPETAASLTEMLVNSTLMQLEDAYEVNDRNPISYFNFVLDPHSFTKSVENMFHFSFLVKEGTLIIFCEIKFVFKVAHAYHILNLDYIPFFRQGIFSSR